MVLAFLVITCASAGVITPPSSTNRYAYAYDDLLSYIDSDGHAAQATDKVECSAATPCFDGAGWAEFVQISQLRSQLGDRVFQAVADTRLPEAARGLESRMVRAFVNPSSVRNGAASDPTLPKPGNAAADPSDVAAKSQQGSSPIDGQHGADKLPPSEKTAGWEDGLYIDAFLYRDKEPTDDRIGSGDLSGDLDGAPARGAEAPFSGTFQIGINTNASIFTKWVGLQAGMAIDLSGGLGLYLSYGGGVMVSPAPPFMPQGSVGIQVAATNAQLISDLRGFFYSYSVAGGAGGLLSGDVVTGPSTHGFVTGGGATLGFGLGASFSSGPTYTSVLTIQEMLLAGYEYLRAGYESISYLRAGPRPWAWPYRRSASTNARGKTLDVAATFSRGRAAWRVA